MKIIICDIFLGFVNFVF